MSQDSKIDPRLSSGWATSSCDFWLVRRL